MALIIEDGSIVVGANSYVTVAEALAYATSRGEPFPTDEDEVEALLLNAMDFTETYRALFSGQKVSVTQETQYPRLNSKVDGVDFPSDAIPRELKNAQCQLAVDRYAIGDLQPTTTGYAVSSEKVDVIEVSYAAASGISGNPAPAEPSFPKAEAWLAPLLAGSSGSWLTTARI